MRILGCIILVILAACSKYDYHTVVKGQLLNYGSREPVDSVLIWLQDGVASGGVLFDNDRGTYSSQIDCTYTDVDGYFDLELKGNHSAVLWAHKDGYTQEVWYSFHDGEHINEIIKIQAKAWFNPVITTKSTRRSTDTIFYKMYSYLNFPDSEFVSLNIQRLVGVGPFNDYLEKTTVGDVYQRYSMTLLRDGKTKFILDSVYIKSFETFIDTIYY